MEEITLQRSGYKICESLNILFQTYPNNERSQDEVRRMRLDVSRQNNLDNSVPGMKKRFYPDDLPPDPFK